MWQQSFIRIDNEDTILSRYCGFTFSRLIFLWALMFWEDFIVICLIFDDLKGFRVWKVGIFEDDAGEHHRVFPLRSMNSWMSYLSFVLVLIKRSGKIFWGSWISIDRLVGICNISDDLKRPDGERGMSEMEKFFLWGPGLNHRFCRFGKIIERKQICGGDGQNDKGLLKSEVIIFWGPRIFSKGFMGICLNLIINK